jgi:hypothetical protein
MFRRTPECDSQPSAPCQLLRLDWRDVNPGELGTIWHPTWPQAPTPPTGDLHCNSNSVTPSSYPVSCNYSETHPETILTGHSAHSLLPVLPHLVLTKTVLFLLPMVYKWTKIFLNSLSSSCYDTFVLKRHSETISSSQPLCCTCPEHTPYSSWFRQPSWGIRDKFKLYLLKPLWNDYYNYIKYWIHHLTLNVHVSTQGGDT